MKYNIIVSLFVFLFLACNPDFNTNQKDIKYHSSKKGLKSNKKRIKSNKKGLSPKTEVNQKNQEVADQNQEVADQNQEVADQNQEVADQNQEVADQNQEVADQNQRKKNMLLNDLRNLIEKANADKEKYEKRLKEEPTDQYGIWAFKRLRWHEEPRETVSDNSERSKAYRKLTYGILNDMDTSELKKFSEIIILANEVEGIFNTSSALGGNIDYVIIHLYPKKDNLDKLGISDLENLKDLFEKLLSTKAIVSKMLKQLLLDYQDNKNSIQTDTTKLKLHVEEIIKQIEENQEEAEKLKSDILSIKNF
ncbi:virulence associated lipoprotein [Borreliella afzelii]|uniref:virulence associated lipoprotein n=1 Tax=Borreliella afzelii TaxID=29518 RepID=UPI00061A4497|nr:borrelia burgdorferi virulent strain associated lipofamily protein [Borreliella afzelii K78]